MQGSKERVRRVVNGQKPDRAPLFDLLTNDAVFRHFNDGRLVGEDDDRTGAGAMGRAIDATRWGAFSPKAEHTVTLADGREQKWLRWTTWTPHRMFSSGEEYRTVKKKELAGWEAEMAKPLDVAKDAWYQQHLTMRQWLGDDFYLVLYGRTPGLMTTYGEIGLEQFSYFLADCEDVIIEQIERFTVMGCRWARDLPADDPFEMVFLGDDMAFKTGTIVNPEWMRTHYFPRLARVIAAIHKRGKKVMFHSDGNLNAVMDDLIAAGIDVLNPIEVAAGMNLKDLHVQYPKLVFAGGIDVSNLLPFGKPEEVRDTVIKAIDDTEGHILVGSSTEVINTVPLENFMAMRNAAMNYRF